MSKQCLVSDIVFQSFWLILDEIFDMAGDRTSIVNFTFVSVHWYQ